MGDLERLLALFRSQIGTKEDGTNNVVYNTDYYGAPVSGDNYPWCCAFVWDVFRMAGLSSLFCGGAKTAYCPYVESWAKSHGQWVEGDYKPGDLLLYDWNGDKVADHIGFCTAWNGQYAYAIEGNTNDRVEEVTRYPQNILGAYRPQYRDENEEKSGVYVVKAGDSLWSIAEKMLGDPWRYHEIEQANHLTSAMIQPGQALIIPGISDVTITISVSSDTYQLLTIMANGWHKTIGQVIDALMEDAV